ncbi:MAG TPA: phosphoribosylanthranilate isomerase [Longimicrobiales bacterium]|nr:phosphoribosylanthranilate isomerase [Longimicrobiales bacterium]
MKICGLMRPEDACAADDAGADYLGVVLSAGFGRSVPLEDAGRIVEGTRVEKVAVLVDESPEGAERAAAAIGAGVLQLHGEEDPAVLAELRRRGPWTLWKSVRARALEDVERAVERYAGVADALLVEGWKEGVTGGGGARLELDPARVRALVGEGLELVLAGGLRPETVAEAVEAYRPDVVDVSSGVEAAFGRKDATALRAFVMAAKSRAAKGSAPKSPALPASPGTAGRAR